MYIEERKKQRNKIVEKMQEFKKKKLYQIKSFIPKIGKNDKGNAL